MNLPAKNVETHSIFCSNPNCNEPFDLDKATAEIQKSGIVYADCGEVIFQGYRCPNPNCRRLWFVSCDRNNPVFDLRDFIMVPNWHEDANTIEQLLIHKNSDNGHDFLKFNFIPAWDDEMVSVQDLFNSHTEVEFDLLILMGTPYVMKQIDFNEKLQSEMETGTIQLRRLYPDIPKFRNFLTCLAPNRITKADEEDGEWTIWAEGDSAEEIQERDAAWRALLEECGGKSLNEAIIGHLKSKGIDCPNGNEVERLIQNELFFNRRSHKDQLRKQAEKAGFEETIWNYFKRSFKEIFYSICTELALAPHRKELTDWVNKAEKGKALFVDAPMGLGKTYSIVEALADNPELSAVIFMPTKKLCEELIFNLKGKIAGKNTTDYWGIYQDLEVVKDSNGNEIIDQDGFPCLQYKRDWLESDVYYADGINEKECPYFNDITERYSYNWIIKKDFCDACKKQPECQFILHDEKAPLSRIVITTHHQYDRFYRNEKIGKWYKNETDNDSDAVDRDFFIVDEDLVLSKCYQPTVLNKDEFREFTTTISNFLVDTEILDGQEAPVEAIDNIDRLFGKFSRCDKTSIIPAIDPEFRFPEFIKESWHKSFHRLPEIVPDSIERPNTVGNHLELVENAIRLGLVVQNYNRLHYNKGEPVKTQIYQAYFSNPRNYDLADLPPHVFFDGTKIDDKFLKRKLRNVEFERMEIKVDSIWQLRVQQNVNSDLPKKWIFRDKDKVQQLVDEIFEELGPDHKYFIVSSKETREAYLEDYLDQKKLILPPIISHYGNLRGINEAKSCDIGIMLGSFLPPDAVEIAMALEFIQDKLPKVVLPTENNLWTWKESNSVRTYKDDYAVVDEMAKTYRLSEHRQAIARTRYLFHDVDFYVLSKDPVESYEPYLPQAETYQFKANIFPPRKKRSDTKYEAVKKAALNWLQDHDTVNATVIHENYGIGRRKAGEWLKVLCSEGTLGKVGNTQYKLPSH